MCSWKHNVWEKVKQVLQLLNEQFNNLQFFSFTFWRVYKYRWVIENLLEVGRHFQKTSYEKEVEGEKQASIKLWKL